MVFSGHWILREVEKLHIATVTYKFLKIYFPIWMYLEDLV